MANPLHQNFFEYQPTKDLNRFLREYGQACLSNTTPAAPDGFVNVTWQTDSTGNMSAYVPQGGQGDLSFKGAWSDTTTYGIGDVVTFEGSSFVGLTADNLNNNPETSGSNWAVLAEGGGGGVEPGSNGLVPFYTGSTEVGPSTINSPDGNSLNIPEGNLSLNQVYVAPAVTLGDSFGGIINLDNEFQVTGPGWSFGNAGGWTTNAATQSHMEIAQRGIGQNRAGYINKHAVGDTAGMYHYIWSDGGIYGQSDEGVTGMTMELNENFSYFTSTVASTTGTGDQAPVFNDSSTESNWTTDGAFMLNISRPLHSGSLTGSGETKWNSSFINLVPTSGSLPLSTSVGFISVGTTLSLSGVAGDGGYIITACVNNPTAALQNLVGQNITILGFTNSSNNGTFGITGFDGSGNLLTTNVSTVAETHAATATSPAICSPQTNSAAPIHMAVTLTLQNVDSVTSRDLVVGDIITVAGSNFPEQSKVTSAAPSSGGNQNVTITIRNPNTSAYFFCGGVQGSYISSAENLAFSGMRSSYYAYGSTDGTNLIYAFNNGGDTINHNNTIPQSGNEAFTTTGAFTLYPGAEVVVNHDLGHNCELEPNRVAWTIGDSVENPHFPVFGGTALWVTKTQKTPTNSSSGSDLVLFQAGGPGWGGANANTVTINNSNPVTMYNVASPTPGPLIPPTGITLNGVYTYGLQMQAQDTNPCILFHGNVNPANALTQTQLVMVFDYLESSAIQFVPDPTGRDAGYYQIQNLNINNKFTVNGNEVGNGATGTYSADGVGSITFAGGTIDSFVGVSYPFNVTADYTAAPTDSFINCQNTVPIIVTLHNFAGTIPPPQVTITNEGTSTVTLSCNSSLPFPTAGYVIPTGGAVTVAAVNGAGTYAIIGSFNP